MRKTRFIQHRRWILWSCCLCFVLNAYQCTDARGKAAIPAETTGISQDGSWSERMAESVMKRNPKAWQLEERQSPKWSYTHGLVSMAFLKLWEQNGEAKYYNYAKGYADDLISEQGEILNYKLEDFNLDNVNPGKILFYLNEKTPEPRYQIVLDTLRRQLTWQPRNNQGGFWHKLRYPWQMWLDGLYMAAPFYAQYAQTYHQPEVFDDIATQFMVMEQFSRDQESGLLYHAWDESKLQQWANRETGCSPHFWGRAMGWYSMALVDVLDYFPEDHAKRPELIAILRRTATAARRFQDEKTGLWYQVVNLPEAEGNYKEATASCMFAYALLKGARKGYLDESFQAAGKKAFEGITENLVEVAEDGEVSLTKCCAVAGLGGNPYRDGSYEYYINETVKNNDPKGTGPFILAGIEMELADDE